jgi:pentatricopeptide repeat protein
MHTPLLAHCGCSLLPLANTHLLTHCVHYCNSEAMYAECTVALCQRGRWQRAKDLLREASAALGTPLAAAPHTAIIRAAGKSGHWRAALALLKEMESGMNKASHSTVEVWCTGSIA